MNYYFLVDQNGSATFSSLPISENGISSTPFEITAEDYQKIRTGTHIFSLVDGVPTLIEAPIIEDIEKQNPEESMIDQERTELKAKLESQSASLEEIQQALSKLL